MEQKHVLCLSAEHLRPLVTPFQPSRQSMFHPEQGVGAVVRWVKDHCSFRVWESSVGSREKPVTSEMTTLRIEGRALRETAGEPRLLKPASPWRWSEPSSRRWTATAMERQVSTAPFLCTKLCP